MLQESASYSCTTTLDEFPLTSYFIPISFLCDELPSSRPNCLDPRGTFLISRTRQVLDAPTSDRLIGNSLVCIDQQEMREQVGPSVITGLSGQYYPRKWSRKIICGCETEVIEPTDFSPLVILREKYIYIFLWRHWYFYNLTCDLIDKHVSTWQDCVSVWCK